VAELAEYGERCPACRAGVVVDLYDDAGQRIGLCCASCDAEWRDAGTVMELGPRDPRTSWRRKKEAPRG